jgi:20S proteasome subunit alpha 2
MTILTLLFHPSHFSVTVRKARKTSQAYYQTYREDEPVSQLVKSTAGVMQEYTQSGGVRPFGVSLLVAGCDSDGTPRLYQVDPSGAYFGWKATAIGKVSSEIIFIYISLLFFSQTVF